MKLKLGAKYRDKITGFEGIATGRVEYITGCDQILLSPPARGGTKPDAQWFDENRVDQVGKKIIRLSSAGDANNLGDKGADIEAPRK